MTDTVLSVNGTRAIGVRLDVPYSGIWTADVNFDGAPVLSGPVTIVVADITLKGVIDPHFSGIWQKQTLVRVVGGARGWQKTVKAKHFHSDAGVKRSTVLSDTAAACKETLANTATEALLGIDWVRASTPGSQTLAALAPVWWVDYAGVTHVADTRPAVTIATATKYDLLDFDPRQRVAHLACDTPSLIPIGATLAGRLDVPAQIRDLTLTVEKGTLRIAAWCPL